jgi:hypothetical protein
VNNCIGLTSHDSVPRLEKAGLPTAIVDSPADGHLPMTVTSVLKTDGIGGNNGGWDFNSRC